MKIYPIGARCFVRDLDPVDDITERAKRAGLHAVVLEENKPLPTTGVVIAVGNDPLLKELVKEGDTVYFAKHSGVHIQVEGKTYRSLEIHEIISVARAED